MKMKNDRTIQIIESYLVIIMNETTPDEYNNFIENNPIIKKYDDFMRRYEENKIPDEILQETLPIVKEKANNL